MTNRILVALMVLSASLVASLSEGKLQEISRQEGCRHLSGPKRYWRLSRNRLWAISSPILAEEHSLACWCR